MASRVNGESHTEAPEQSATSEDNSGTLDHALMPKVPEDPRFESGVPESQRTSPVDFVKLTGLTRPQVKHRSAPTPPPKAERVEDTDPSAPLSFYEKGVSDVDHTMSPPGLEPMPADANPPARPKPPEAPLEVARGESLAEGEPKAPLHEKPTSRTQEPAAASPVPVIEHAPRETAHTSTGTEIPARPTPRPDTRNRLAEAEQLLQELEQQPRETRGAPAEVMPAASQSGAQAGTAPQRAYEAGIPLTGKANPPAKQRSSRQGRRRRRILGRVFQLLLVLFVLAGALFAYQYYVRPSVSGPEDLLAQARAMMDEGRYEEASDQLSYFALRFPEHAAKADASFDAALALRLAANTTSGDRARSFRDRALEAFRYFTRENPGSEKLARAECLMGVLLYDLERYPECIEALRAPNRQIQDPVAALTVLRTLARAYAKQGSYAEAESAYLQAAVLPKNYTPDVDYYELGSLHRGRADTSAEPDEAARLRKRAADFWTQAMRTPGIDPVRRETIKEQISWLEPERELGPEEMTESGAGTPQVPVETVVPASLTAVTKIDNSTEAEMNPLAEMELLEGAPLPEPGSSAEQNE